RRPDQAVERSDPCADDPATQSSVNAGGQNDIVGHIFAVRLFWRGWLPVQECREGRKSMTKSSKNTKNTTSRTKVASGSMEIKRDGGQIFVGGLPGKPPKKTK